MNNKSKVLLVVLTVIFVCSAFSVTFAEAQPVEVWNVTWGVPGGDEGQAVATVGDCVYLAGNIDGVDAFLNKYDSDGNLLWNITWAMFPPSEEWYSDSVAMAATKDSVYLAGVTASPNNSDCDAFLNRYDSDGNLIWNITWSGPGCYAAFDAAASGDCVYVAGREDHKAGWVNGRAVAATNDCVYLAGTTAVSDTANGSAFLVKYSEPTPIPTVTPVPTLTLTPTPTPKLETTAPIETPTAAPPAATPSATPTPPGFEAVFAISGLLAVAFLVWIKRRN